MQHTADGLFLNQSKNASELLLRAGLSASHPMPTPMVAQSSVTSDELYSDVTNFCSLAGGVQYLTLTRPDISFAINAICQKMHAPTV